MKTLNPCAWIRRVRYPATPEGRRKYIQDSLDDSYRTYRLKELVYAILIGLTCIGLLAILISLLF